MFQHLIKMFFYFAKALRFFIGAFISYNCMILLSSHAEDFSIRSSGMLPLNSLGQKLYKEIRILCWVLSSPADFQLKDEHIRRTWGRRCNKLLFMGSPCNGETV